MYAVRMVRATASMTRRPSAVAASPAAWPREDVPHQTMETATRAASRRIATARNCGTRFIASTIVPGSSSAVDGPRLPPGRVDRPAVHAHLEVYVRTRAVPGTPHAADDLALSHAAAFLGEDLREVGVECGDAAAVVDDDDLPVSAEPPGVDDAPVGRGLHRCAAGCADVHARMHPADAEDGMPAEPEAGGERPAGGPDECSQTARQRGLRHGARLHPKDEHFEVLGVLLQLAHHLLVRRPLALEPGEHGPLRLLLLSDLLPPHHRP